MAIGVVGIVEHNGRILIGKKSRTEHPLSDVWHIPGGMLKP